MKYRMTALLSVAASVAALTGGLTGCTAYPYDDTARPQSRGYDPYYYDDPRPRDYYDDPRSRDYDVRVVFSDHDRMVIRDYYRHYYRNLPPGLAKQGKVPPGHAYRMRRHQGVPRDVTWQYLPSDVERRLHRLPEGYVRVVIGTDVGILHTRSRVVLDVIGDIDN